MSCIFKKKSYTDLVAIETFIQNSYATILSNESYHAIVVLLKLNNNVESPYSKIFFDTSQNKIITTDVTSIVLKLIPIKFDKSFRGTVQNEKLTYGGIMSEKRVSSFAEFEHEIVVQKLAFHATYMIDFQMRGSSPNILLSFLVNFTNKKNFTDLFRVSTSERKDRMEGFDSNSGTTSTHNFIFNRFIDSVLTSSIYKIGCIVMEYLNNSNDLSDYTCFKPKIIPPTKKGQLATKSYGDINEYNKFLIAKAIALIELDKCMFSGIYHKDIHPGNVVTYETENEEMHSSIIDFGKSEIHVGLESNCSSERKRQFNILDNSTDAYDIPVKEGTNKRNRYKGYVQSCLINSNSYVDSDINIFTEGVLNLKSGLENWNDLSEKNPNNEKRQNVIQTSYKFVPIEIMNKIDKKMVERGMQIYKFLLGDKDINEYIQKDNELVISKWTSNTKNGGISLLYDYIKEQNLDENCQSFLLSKNIYCVDKYNTEPVVVTEKEGGNGKRKEKGKRKKNTYKKKIHTKKFGLTAKKYRN